LAMTWLPRSAPSKTAVTKMTFALHGAAIPHATTAAEDASGAVDAACFARAVAADDDGRVAHVGREEAPCRCVPP
jgi:hypothetical protein